MPKLKDPWTGPDAACTVCVALTIIITTDLREA